MRQLIVHFRHRVHDVGGVVRVLLVLHHGVGVGTRVPGQLLHVYITLVKVWSGMEH